jgi:hypothetical protein
MEQVIRFLTTKTEKKKKKQEKQKRGKKRIKEGRSLPDPQRVQRANVESTDECHPFGVLHTWKEPKDGSMNEDGKKDE